jgi:hypothetical protein
MRENVPFSLIAGRQADLLLSFQGGRSREKFLLATSGSVDVATWDGRNKSGLATTRVKPI